MHIWTTEKVKKIFLKNIHFWRFAPNFSRWPPLSAIRAKIWDFQGNKFNACVYGSRKRKKKFFWKIFIFDCLPPKKPKWPPSQNCFLWFWSKNQTCMCDTSFNMYLKLKNLIMRLILWCMKILRLFLQY